MLARFVPGLILISLLGSGCAIHEGRPGVAFFDPPPQSKLKSASHWQIIAGDVSKGMVESSQLRGKRIYVSDDSKSKFARIFAASLKSSLVSSGATVSATQSGSAVLQVQVDSVRHNIVGGYRPGTLTALAAGIAVIRDTTAISAARDLLSGALVGADIYQSAPDFKDRPTTELVVTASVRDGDTITFSRTSVYYIDEADQQLFDEPPTAAPQRTFTLVGGDIR